MSIETRISQYGTVFGDWHIGQLLGSGSGGRSAVFELYRDNNGWREFSALKVVNLIEERGSQEALSQFRKTEYSTAVRAQRDNADQEVHLMEKLRGKTNIVDYLDHQFFDWSDSSGFGVDLLIRMEKLTDLRSQLKQGRIFSEAEIISIGKDICQALVICHKKNILHRDIKPENIFFNSDGDYKLGDFGVSRIMDNTPSAVASTGIGTAAYSAPEQFSGTYDKRVDIYSLGLVLYELCNGNRLPFARSSYIRQEEIQIRLAGAELPPPGGNGGGDPYSTAPAVSPLAQVILKACAFKPENRYQTAEEMLQALSSLSGHHTIPPVADPYATAPADPSPYQTTPASSHNTEFAYFSNAASASPKVSVPTAGPVSDPGRGSQPQLKKLLPLILGAIALIALVLLLFFPDVAKTHEHVWTAATCTSPRTCEECGETEGEALGHAWTAGSCTAPRTCLTCGQTDGAALGHQWVDATYQQPQTCSVCGATEGTALTQDWVYLNELSYIHHDGKVWTLSNEAPDFPADSDHTDSSAYDDTNTPGHVTGPVYDHLGNEYTYGLCVDGSEFAEYSISYYVGGQYHTFSGYISMIPEMLWEDDANKGKYFEVLGDGVVLYRSPTMTLDLAAQQFSVDITGVEVLTIRYPRTSGPSWMATIFDGKLS